jgi:hypothetical protein
MGLRGIVRDGIYIYLALLILNSVITAVPLTVFQLIGIAGVLLFFSIWFFLERFCIVPRM